MATDQGGSTTFVPPGESTPAITARFRMAPNAMPDVATIHRLA
jgi:hypothetical protein